MKCRTDISCFAAVIPFLTLQVGMFPLWQTLRSITDCTFSFKAHMSNCQQTSRVDLHILLVVMNNDLFTNQTGWNTVETSFYFDASVDVHFAGTYGKEYKWLFR